MPSKDMYCPECVEILQSGDASRLHEVKNEGGLYHYSGSMNRHRQNAHGVQVVKLQTIAVGLGSNLGVDLS